MLQEADNSRVTKIVDTESQRGVGDVFSKFPERQLTTTEEFEDRPLVLSHTFVNKADP
jgi:hypothetical protein